MINIEDQENLFRIIANNLTQDVTCFAFGGNAMMYYGYKEETKDVDLLFETKEERQAFINSIQRLGFENTSAVGIYMPEKLRDPGKPLVYQRRDDEGRFDLFVGSIFRSVLSPRMKEDIFAVHRYKGKHTITVKILSKEQLVILKAVTSRERDYHDIVTIIKKDKHFNWQYLIDEVIWQHKHGDSWVVLNVEEKMKELQKELYIPEKFLKQLYEIL